MKESDRRLNVRKTRWRAKEKSAQDNKGKKQKKISWQGSCNSDCPETSIDNDDLCITGTPATNK